MQFCLFRKLFKLFPLYGLLSELFEGSNVWVNGLSVEGHKFH